MAPTPVPGALPPAVPAFPPQTSLGVGLGWRPALARFVERRCGASRPGGLPNECRDGSRPAGTLGFVEVIAEHITPRALPEPLSQLRDHGVPVVVHGLGLSLGGAERPDARRLAHLADCAEQLHAPLVSEHLAFVRAVRLDSGHLLPVPRTRAALDVVCENVSEAQGALPVPLAVENIATLLEWPDQEFSEADFLAELVERTGVRLLVDVANLYANSRNHGTDPVAMLDRLPVEQIAYVHVAGGIECRGRYHDTHRHALPPVVLDLLAELCARSAPPGVLVEWDGDFPTDTELDAEISAVAGVLRRTVGRQRAGVATRAPGRVGGIAPRSEGPAPVVPGRQGLAGDQAALLAALVADAPLPRGFDPGAGVAVASSLRLRPTSGRPSRGRGSGDSHAVRGSAEDFAGPGTNS